MKRTITVVGTGAVTAAPDIATVDVGVQVQAANAQDAPRCANALTTAVLDAVRGAGVDDGDLCTNGPHLWPNDRRYQCSDDIAVVVRDVSIAGSVVDVAAGAGGPSFTGEQTVRVDVTVTYRLVEVVAAGAATRT